MLISTNWISDFVKLPEITPTELGKKFTMTTAEVEGVEVSGLHLKTICVVQILTVEKHPEADKLNLVTFDMGGGKTHKVVCGASNVSAGLKVPFASLGTKLPNGMVLEPKAIRGIMSEGMLCSASELGFETESHGLLELPESALVGATMLEHFQMTADVVLNVDNKSLTHRPDLWGHYGIAREFSAIFQTPLLNPFDRAFEERVSKSIVGGTSPIKVRFDGESAGVAYFGLSVDNVTVKESPDFIKRRLLAVGLRPINNIVDISNYVMLELGIPLHIFDREKIQGGEVVIHELKDETEFTTLDEQVRKLIPGDTVISDSTGPLVLAGIMGGLKSGVSDNTKNIFIEVANWKPAMVRRTSTRLGLRTDSLARYEKSLDSLLLKRTLLRTLELVLNEAPDAKVIGSLEYAGQDLSLIKPLILTLDHDAILKVIGPLATKERVMTILTSLGFLLTQKGESFEVLVPSYRATKDIECNADIIEELGRVIGYDNILPAAPQVFVAPVSLTPAQKMGRKIADFMQMHGNAFEILTYPLIGKKLLDKVAWKQDNLLTLINSLSEDHEVMRPSLLPTLLEAVAVNQKNQTSCRMFELGRTYHPSAKDFREEKNQVAIAFYSKDATPFIDLENCVVNLLNSLNLSFELTRRDEKFPNPYFDKNWIGAHPFEQLNIKIMGKFQGTILSIHPILLRNLKIRGHLSVAIIDLSSFEARPLKEKTKYKPLSNLPSSTFDWTVVAGTHVPVEDIIKSAQNVKIKEIVSVKILDIYNRESDKTVTLRALFFDPEKTLEAPILERAQRELIAACESNGFKLKN